MKNILIGTLCLAAPLAIFAYFHSGEETPDSQEMSLGHWQNGEVWLKRVENAHYEISWRGSEGPLVLAVSDSYPLSIHFEKTTGSLEVVTEDAEGGYLFEIFPTPEKSVESVHCPELSQVRQRVGSSSPLRFPEFENKPKSTKALSNYIKPEPYQIYEVAIGENLFFNLPSGFEVAVFGEEENNQVIIHMAGEKAIAVGGPTDSVSVMTMIEEQDGWKVNLSDTNFDGIPDQRIRRRGKEVIVETASTNFTVKEQ